MLLWTSVVPKLVNEKRNLRKTNYSVENLTTIPNFTTKICNKGKVNFYVSKLSFEKS